MTDRLQEARLEAAPTPPLAASRPWQPAGLSLLVGLSLPLGSLRGRAAPRAQREPVAVNPPVPAIQRAVQEERP